VVVTRRSQFTVDAQSVQGNAGATATFRTLTVGEYQNYLDDPDYRDRHLVKKHLVAWSGIVGNDDVPLPDPTDDPDAMNALYLHEVGALAILLVQGPLGASAKNLPTSS
jgi:hypothetical protein